MSKRKVVRVDLFCGCGGAGTGGDAACRDLGLEWDGVAINHDAVAVQTYSANHAEMRTLCMGVEAAIPSELVPGGRVNLLWASPSCTHHSRAKGGHPRSNQLRSQPHSIFHWTDTLFVDRIFVENVPEFLAWGPLDIRGRPIERKKGEYFLKWVDNLKARNYMVDWRVVCCADYGDATTRRRLFVQAVRRGCGKIRWPEPTHAENPQPDLWGNMPLKWRGADEFLDFSDLGTSIFNRARLLSRNTLLRVAVGMQKFNGMDFIMDMLGLGDGGDESRVHPLSEPLGTQHAGGNRFAAVRPFVVRLNRNCDAESVSSPLSCVTANGQHHMLCQPLILDHLKGGEARPVGEPLGTQHTHDRYSLVQPFLIDYFGLKANHAHHVKSVGAPLPTVTTEPHHYLCTPLLLGQQGGAAARPATEPCPTIATGGAIRMATPVFLEESVAGLPRLPDGRYLDIRIRMLKPSELAAAHSFPPDYVLAGNRTQQIKQIGNSVPVRTAAAMCEAALSVA